MKANMAAVALGVSVSFSVAAATSSGIYPVSMFGDIKYWVGEGTNRCAIVVDFNDGSVANCSFAWGYRWNGEAPSVKEILDEITADDPRLKMFASSSQYGTFIDAFGYDADGDGGTFTLKNFVKSDEDDLFPATESYSETDPETGNYIYSGTSWMQLSGSGTTFADVTFAETPNGVDYTNPTNGEWICWRFCTYSTTYDSSFNFIDYYSYIDSEYSPVAAGRAFRIDNIRYWMGSGTNRCAIVIDFNDGSVENCSFAWGYRWNGDAPSVKAILDEITAKDSRLKMFASSSEYGAFINAFGYDADGDGGTFTLKNFVKSDEDDLFPATESYSETDQETGNNIYSGTSWMQLSGSGAMFADVTFAETPNGVDYTNPTNGEWICWRFCTYSTTYDSSWNFIDYYSYIDSEYSPVAGYPSDMAGKFYPKVGFSTYASIAAAFDAARGGGAVTLPEQSAVDADAKTVTVGTEETETLQTYSVPAYYDMSASGSSVSLALNAQAAPTLAASGDASAPEPFTVTDELVTVVPGNVIDGLYYGLSVSTNLTGGFSAPTEWVRAENGTVVLEKVRDATLSAAFYKVRVSDVDEAGQ